MIFNEDGTYIELLLYMASHTSTLMEMGY